MRREKRKKAREDMKKKLMAFVEKILVGTGLKNSSVGNEEVKQAQVQGQRRHPSLNPSYSNPSTSMFVLDEVLKDTVAVAVEDLPINNVVENQDEGLHARFSCLSREYKYFFWRGNLDLSVMSLNLYDEKVSTCLMEIGLFHCLLLKETLSRKWKGLLSSPAHDHAEPPSMAPSKRKQAAVTS